MKSTLRRFAMFLLCVSLACAVPRLLAKKKDKVAASGAAEQKRAVHALNRLTFGPRPGDVQQVMAMGVDAWIDSQLHPERIPDSAVESRLAPFRTLRMSSREIVEEFPDNQMIKQVMEGKKPMPTDPARRAVFQVQIARMGEKQEEKKAAVNLVPATAPVPASTQPAASDTAKTAEELAAAAAASGDASGNAPNNLADANGMNAMNSSSSGPPSNGAPANDASLAPPAETKNTPTDDL